jgi:hypothetical protein
MWFQIKVLELTQGIEYATSWKNIMVDAPFVTPDGSGIIKYNTGQPMGAKSS